MLHLSLQLLFASDLILTSFLCYPRVPRQFCRGNIPVEITYLAPPPLPPGVQELDGAQSGSNREESSAALHASKSGDHNALSLQPAVRNRLQREIKSLLRQKPEYFCYSAEVRVQVRCLIAIFKSKHAASRRNTARTQLARPMATSTPKESEHELGQNSGQGVPAMGGAWQEASSETP